MGYNSTWFTYWAGSLKYCELGWQRPIVLFYWAGLQGAWAGAQARWALGPPLLKMELQKVGLGRSRLQRSSPDGGIAKILSFQTLCKLTYEFN